MMIDFYRRTGFADNSKGVLMIAGYCKAQRITEQLLMNVPDSIYITV